MDSDGQEVISPDSLGKKVLSEALQHPSTLIPAAASILGGLYMALINTSPTSFATTLTAGTVALISVLFHYFVRGEAIMKRELSKHRSDQRESERKRAETLMADCRARGFDQGGQAMEELLVAYDRLGLYLRQAFARERRSSGERFIVLSEEVLHQGISLVQRSLDLFLAIRELDYAKMRIEMERWQKELDGGIAPDAETQALLRSRLASHQKRIDLHTGHQKNLLANLSQCEVLEASLDAAYLELVDLSAGGGVDSSVRSAQSLERMVESARKVEEKLRRATSGPSNDEIYDISKQNRGNPVRSENHE